MIRVAARDRWRREIVSSSRRTQRPGIGRETGGRENAQDDENDPALPLSSLHPLPFALVSFQLSRPKSERTVPGQETSIARRGSRGRTHCAGTRRTLPGTSQGVPRGEALPLGEVNWTGTRACRTARPQPVDRERDPGWRGPLESWVSIGTGRRTHNRPG
ncbi:MAG: hypothetical protein HW376_1209 [candidate division NC10 bacterium]|nr:hypothetical protein [candidate division NC10 bacterium]MBM2836041.1 hypothetical protein [candidate division NC10 bacterium]